MDSIEHTRNQILMSDEFVFAETQRIRYAYELKSVIRYGLNRQEELQTESVAEHVYGLHLLADYFLPLEDPNHELDWHKVHDMLQYHDIDEIETGDIISYLKTDAEREAEDAVLPTVISRFPKHLQQKITTLLDEYEDQETAEARFARALDRIEPQFQLLSEEGKKISIDKKTTLDQNDRVKVPFIEPYPCMYRFYEVATAYMVKEGFFHSE